MKRALFFFFTLLLSSFSYGQFTPIYRAAADNLQRSTLEVVLTGEEKYDTALKLVISDELSAYDYEFISQETFDQHKEGDEIFALISSQGEFDLPMAGGLLFTIKDHPFFGIVSEYHHLSKEYKAGYNIVMYTLNIPGKGKLKVEPALRLYIRNLNNEIREQGDDFTATMKERQDWAQEYELLIPDWSFESSTSLLKKSYPYSFKVVPTKRVEEAIKNNEEVVVCFPYVTKSGETTASMYFNYFFVKDGVIIDMYNTSFLAKENKDKYKAMKAKAEQKALKVYAKNVK